MKKYGVYIIVESWEENPNGDVIPDSREEESGLKLGEYETYAQAEQLIGFVENEVENTFEEVIL